MADRSDSILQDIKLNHNDGAARYHSDSAGGGICDTGGDCGGDVDGRERGNGELRIDNG